MKNAGKTERTSPASDQANAGSTGEWSLHQCVTGKNLLALLVTVVSDLCWLGWPNLCSTWITLLPRSVRWFFCAPVVDSNDDLGNRYRSSVLASPCISISTACITQEWASYWCSKVIPFKNNNGPTALLGPQKCVKSADCVKRFVNQSEKQIPQLFSGCKRFITVTIAEKMSET